jgi:hypothetical protein
MQSQEHRCTKNGVRSAIFECQSFRKIIIGAVPCIGQLTLLWLADRDHPHADRRQYRTGYYTLMLYLSDVDERTPCFSISPEGAGDDLLPAPQQLAERGFHDLHGPAGTAVLFNLSVLHRASGHARTVARSTHERKSLQLYYTHRVYQEGDRGTPHSWAEEMRRWRVERSEQTSDTPDGGRDARDQSTASEDDPDDAGAEAPGVNVDPDPGPTEETLVVAAHKEVCPPPPCLLNCTF